MFLVFSFFPFRSEEAKIKKARNQDSRLFILFTNYLNFISDMSAMATLNSVQDRVRGFLRQKNSFTNVLEIIETKTKVNREYIFYG